MNSSHSKEIDSPHSISILAPTSGSGKTTIAMGLIRTLADIGIKVAPFKAATVTDFESDVAFEGVTPWKWGVMHNCAIAGMDVLPVNNPVAAVKEKKRDNTADLYLWGEWAGTVPVRGDDCLDLRILPERTARACRSAVLEALDTLKESDGYVVLEGAGAAGDIPLHADLANYTAPLALGASVVLVANVARSGGLASIIGTQHLLDPRIKELVSGYICNQARDNEHQEFVIDRITAFTGLECLGSVGELRDLDDYDASPSQMRWLYNRTAKRVGESGILDHLVLQL